LVLKPNSAILTSTQIVGDKYLLLFCTEATIYGEVMNTWKMQQIN